MRTIPLAAVAALAVAIGASAHAADMRPLYKATPPAPVYNWSGCYVGAGGGYGKSSEETALVSVRALPGIPVGTDFVDGITQGDTGWLATAQVGCDFQFAGPIGGNWVIGAFVDGDWADIHGRHTGGDVNIGLQQGEEKLSRSWAAGGRLGWLVNPQLLTYVSGGFTEAQFDSVNYVSALFPAIGAPTGLQLPGRTQQGWFLGGGVEYAIGWLPGLFVKTEYRYADYGTVTETVNCTSAALCGLAGPTSFAERLHPTVQTITTELVWRFNWRP